MIKSSEQPSSGSQSDALSRLPGLLAGSGLNLCSLLPVGSLAPRWQAMLPDFGRLAPARQLLLLVGNAGPAFWSACQASGFAAGVDQVDRFAVDRCLSALRSLPVSFAHKLLYPSIPGEGTPQCRLSLQALGEAAGWHQDSPLGIGINPQYGLWYAYRCLVLLDFEPQSAETGRPAPDAQMANSDICLKCETQDCIKACPAAALSMRQLPDMQRCMGYRLQTGSDCAGQCLARNACPISPASRYTAAQTDYHYRLSLASIKRYVEK